MALTIYDQNLHTHGVLDDGKSSYESTVKRAIELGFTSLGFSGHSHTPYASQFCMTVEGTEAYKREIRRLQDVYRERIELYCGVEFDMYSTDPLQGYDYVIGSLHYFRFGETYVGFDRSADEVRRVIDDWFDGDGMRYAQAYYEKLAELPRFAKVDIVGHLDLVAKHNDTMHYFDSNNSRYIRYATDAIDALAGHVTAFEINTGCIVRGYRATPYPEIQLLRILRERNCQIVISSDCHDNRYLNYGFSECLELARACGYREVMKLTKNGFVTYPI